MITSEGGGSERAGSMLAARRSWIGYAQALVLVGLVTLLGVVIGRIVAPVNLVMLYLAAVVIAAMYLGRMPSILTAFLSVVAFDFFIVPPRHTLAVADTQYLLTFAGLLIVGLVISSLTGQARDQAEAAQRREAQAVALYEFSRDLGSAGNLTAILDATIAHVFPTFGRKGAIFLPLPDRKLVVSAATPGFRPSGDQNIVAEWVFQHGQPAGRGTEALITNEMECSATANAARRRRRAGCSTGHWRFKTHNRPAPAAGDLCRPGGACY